MHNSHIKSSFAFWNFLDKLKIAKVTAIHKICYIKIITNFTPISVFPVISKFFKRVICDHLRYYFDSNNLLCSQQYGFIKKIVNRVSGLEVIDRLLSQRNKNKVPINLYLDLGKPIDSLCYNIFLIS